MIIAKIRRKAPNRSGRRSEHAYAARLTNYIVRANPDELRKLAAYGDEDYVADLARYVIAEGRAEEVLATGARGLLGETLEDQQAEMMALMHRCPDPSGALDHWVMSWAEGEEPEVEEIEEAIDIFLRCQGLERAALVWGYHGDTENRHAHLAILRIDTQTGQRQTAGGGWDIDCGHRAKAVIEDAFPHWSREEGSLYEVRSEKLFRKNDAAEIGPADEPNLWRAPGKREKGVKAGHSNTKGSDIDRRLDQPSHEYEAQKGLKSRKRIALEIAVPIALRAGSWEECHCKLAAEGIALARTRYGANFIIDGKAVKASIDRSSSYAKLKALYGGEEYKPSTYPLEPSPIRVMWPNNAKRSAYYAAKRDHDARLKAIVQKFRAGHGGRASGQVTTAALGAAAEAAAFPSFEEWSGGSRPLDPVEVISDALGFGIIETSGALGGKPREESCEAFSALKLGDRVIYHRLGDPPGRPSFIDLGNRVLVNAAKDREAVRAALLLTARNNPGCEIAVLGDRAFKRLALEIANQEGVTLHGALGRKQARKQETAERQQSQKVSAPRARVDEGTKPKVAHPKPEGKGSASSASSPTAAKKGNATDVEDAKAKAARAAQIAAARAAAERGF